MIHNPILRGFHPDPSIVRVNDDYYIATSTFEWFPGVRIHHSKDLVHWRPLTYPLTRPEHLQLAGTIDSGGVWAPCLSYDNGVFYLIYTDVKSRMGKFKDTHNYLVTATDIMGPWSDPIYLNSSGFDPSLFHDDDGRKWLLNMQWDHRQGNHPFGGILMQEYSPEERKLVGPVRNIFRGTKSGLTEGPHVYKRDGYYYLLTAEGGTGYDHQVTFARSRQLEGPYELSPNHPVLTSSGTPELELQKAGHADLVETQTGEWYMVHLVGRPVREGYCMLGRETAIQRCHWTEDGWLEVEGGPSPQLEVQAPALPLHPFEPLPETDHFDSPELGIQWNTLRIPATPDWLSLTERPGHLRLYGQESPISINRQSIVARRQQSMDCEAETSLDFDPQHYPQMAGLILYYDTQDYVYLRVSRDDEVGRCLNIFQSINGKCEEALDREVSIAEQGHIRLKVVIRRERAQFYYAEEGGDWTAIGPALDVSHLCDESPVYIRFTGTYIGVCVQDTSGARLHADFDYFRYTEQ
ncbi:glycoside hydrolase 43 family protein [Paenibacillus sp. 598K]|uniref:glycoside hydrolase family 43 protein n=1 Tax=Paenibacillus sp. 598K TaxID=1117987 RepID=UPI000FF9B0F9|nr:glycoside hydrolase family 43 protein [Paenibacillus sp. 598K]GBF75400.1 glycoside hydrolase 43 family protein [Paenibacillus sp. 598K]